MNPRRRRLLKTGRRQSLSPELYQEVKRRHSIPSIDFVKDIGTFKAFQEHTALQKRLAGKYDANGARGSNHCVARCRVTDPSYPQWYSRSSSTVSKIDPRNWTLPPSRQTFR